MQLRHVTRALSAANQVDLLVARVGDQAYVERQGNARILRVPVPEPHLGGLAEGQIYQRALRRQLEGADYDIVHFRDGWGAKTILEARQRLGCAVVFDASRSPLGEDADDNEISAMLASEEAAAMAQADLVLVPSEAAREQLANNGRREHVAVAPVGVDVDRFDWDEEPITGIPTAIYVGALAPGRGVRVLIRAWADVVSERPARLLLVGPIHPAFAEELTRGIADLGLTPHVELRGPIDNDDVPALLATATICVAPSAIDPAIHEWAMCPTKILEYMACRRAVVAPMRSNTMQVIEHGLDGLLFSPGDPLDLARKILRVLDDEDLRNRLADAGYQRVRRDHTASAARRAMQRAYDELTRRFADRFAAAARSSNSSIEPSGVVGGLRADHLRGGYVDDDSENTEIGTPPQASESADTNSIGTPMPTRPRQRARNTERTSENAISTSASNASSGNGMIDAPTNVRPAPTAPATQPTPKISSSSIVTNPRSPLPPIPAGPALSRGSTPNISRAVTVEDGTPVEGSRLANFERSPTPLQQSTFVAGEIEADSSVNVRQARQLRAVSESAAGFPGLDDDVQVEHRRAKTMEISASIVIDEYAARSEQSRNNISTTTQSAAMIRPPTAQVTAQRPATPPITIQTFVMPDDVDDLPPSAPITTPMASIEPVTNATTKTPPAGISVVDDGDAQH